MKLLYCKACGDIMAIRGFDRVCFCGKSAGHRTRQGGAMWSGPCVRLEYATLRLDEAIGNQPEVGWGDPLPIFVMPAR